MTTVLIIGISLMMICLTENLKIFLEITANTEFIYFLYNVVTNVYTHLHGAEDIRAKTHQKIVHFPISYASEFVEKTVDNGTL